jgi:hypothetical protein
MRTGAFSGPSVTTLIGQPLDWIVGIGPRWCLQEGGDFYHCDGAPA